MDVVITSRMQTKPAVDEDLISILGRGGASGIEWCGFTVQSIFLRALECKMYLLSSFNTPIKILSQAERVLKTPLVPLVETLLTRIDNSVIANPTVSDIKDVFLCSDNPLHTIVVLLAVCIRMQSLQHRMVSVAPICAIITRHLDPKGRKYVLDSISEMLKL